MKVYTIVKQENTHSTTDVIIQRIKYRELNYLFIYFFSFFSVNRGQFA